MRRLSVRTQLTLWFAACLVAGMAAFGAGIYSLFGRYLLGEVDRGLEEEIAEVVREVRLANPGGLLAELAENFAGHPYYVIRVTGPAGEPVFDSLPDGPPVPTAAAGPDPRTVAVPGRPPHRLIVRVVARPDGRYGVAVAEPLTLYHRLLGRLALALALLGPAVAAGSLFGGYWLARRAMAPVDRLTQAALSITAAGLHRRVPEDSSGDEVGRLAAAFNVMIGRLEAAFDEVRRFAADAAHELRTPLAVLKTGTEVALRAEGTADGYRRTLADHLEQIDRLSRLTDQLLFLCREDARVETEPPAEVRLDLLLEELCEGLQPLAGGRSVSLACDETSPCVVAGPPDRLRRLFLNLIDNALRYTPAGGRVDVRAATGQGVAVVTVEDDGVGIAPEHLPRLFERFYRADPSRNRETGGSGLGLAICRSIADSLAASVSLRSEPGRGTTAEVRLAARDVGPVRSPAPATPP